MKNLFVIVLCAFSLLMLSPLSAITADTTATKAVDTVVAATADTTTAIVPEDLSVWEQFVTTLSGEDITTGVYFASFLLVAIGLFIRWYIATIRGIKRNPDSPAKFDFMYWITHNWLSKLLSVAFTVAITYCTLRFIPELTQWMGFKIPPLSTACLAVGIGVCFDWVVSRWAALKLTGSGI